MMQHDDSNGRHKDDKGQQGDRRHNDAGGGNNGAGGIGTSIILLSFGLGDMGRGEADTDALSCNRRRA
jgi:hypothetical protein